MVDVDARLWQRVATQGRVPAWRSLHTGVTYTSLVDGSEHFIIMGGCEEHLKVFTAGKPADMVGYSLNLKTMTWRRGGQYKKHGARRCLEFIPKPRMRFSAERYGRHLLVYGRHGENFMEDEPLLTLNLMTLQW